MKKAWTITGSIAAAALITTGTAIANADGRDDRSGAHAVTIPLAPKPAASESPTEDATTPAAPTASDTSTAEPTKEATTAAPKPAPAPAPKPAPAPAPKPAPKVAPKPTYVQPKPKATVYYSADSVDSPDWSVDSPDSAPS